MTNSGVNKGFAKCFILFMALVILLQGIAYLGLSLWGLILENCSNETTNVSLNPFDFVMKFIYFINQRCGDPSITVDGVTNPVTLQVNWSQSFQITNRVFIMLIAYVAVSAVWIITALMVIATLFSNITPCYVGAVYVPWLIAVLAGSVLDAVATGYFIKDVVHTTSVSEAFQYVGVQLTNEISSYFNGYEAYFVTPAIIMTCISSRVVLIWLLNIFGTSFCVSLSRVLAKREVTPVVEIQEPQQPSQVQATRSNADTARALNPLTPSPQQQQYQQQAQSPYPNQAQPNYQNSLRQVQTVQSPLPQQQPNPNSINYLNSQPPANASAPDIAYVPESTYRNTANHPENFNYPPQLNIPPIRSDSPRTDQPSSPLSPISPLNTRYNESLMQPSQRVSEELRGQLPWSYTNLMAKPQVPRKPQQQQSPEPDYPNN